MYYHLDVEACMFSNKGQKWHGFGWVERWGENWEEYSKGKYKQEFRLYYGRETSLLTTKKKNKKKK